jgi:hypothetical protein
MLHFVPVDGKTWHRGLNLFDMADLLVSLGVVNAINLDGGGRWGRACMRACVRQLHHATWHSLRAAHALAQPCGGPRCDDASHCGALWQRMRQRMRQRQRPKPNRTDVVAQQRIQFSAADRSARVALSVADTQRTTRTSYGIATCFTVKRRVPDTHTRACARTHTHAARARALCFIQRIDVLEWNRRQLPER